MTATESIVLHSGNLSFSARSLGDGPLVLCLHGFPDNAGSYREQLPVLAAAGYRAVAVTMRGYEPSSQPLDNDYSMEAIAADVIDFVAELGGSPAHLVGHDWGAAVAYTAAARKPELFASLTTMAVPHSGRFLNEVYKYPRQLLLSWYMGFFQLRGIAERTIERNDFRFIRRLWYDWSPGWAFAEDAFAEVIATLRQPGVIAAALGYYRAALAPAAFSPSARAAARFQVSVPTLALTGERDGCIDTYVFQKMMHQEDFPAGLQVEQIPAAGHFPHQEQPQTVNRLLLEWLGRWQRAID